MPAKATTKAAPARTRTTTTAGGGRTTPTKEEQMRAMAAAAEEAAYAEDVEELGVFGEADEATLAELRRPPIPFRIKGYDIDDPRPDKFEMFTFHVKPHMEFGPIFNALMAMREDGSVDIPTAVQFIGDAIIADDRQRFIDTMRRPDLHFEAGAIGELTQALATRYGLRPTTPRSVRRNGSRRTGRTTTARR